MKRTDEQTATGKPGDVFYITTENLYGGHVLREDGTTVPIIPSTEQPVIARRADGIHMWETDGDHWRSVDDGKTFQRVTPDPLALDWPRIVREHAATAPTGSEELDLRRRLSEAANPCAFGEEPTAELPEIIGSDRMAAIRAELDSIDRYATGLRLPADLTKELRRLLRLPRKT